MRKEAFLGEEELLGFKPTNLLLIEKDAYSTWIYTVLACDFAYSCMFFMHFILQIIIFLSDVLEEYLKNGT